MRQGVNLPELAAHIDRRGIRIWNGGDFIIDESRHGRPAGTCARTRRRLLVIGAHGIRGILEFVLGGTTQGPLERTTIPLFNVALGITSRLIAQSPITCLSLFLIADGFLLFLYTAAERLVSNLYPIASISTVSLTMQVAETGTGI
jgi:hypothetical protein